MHMPLPTTGDTQVTCGCGGTPAPSSSPSVCPACGYCPHCGRGGAQTIPFYPQTPYPWWVPAPNPWTTIICTTTTGGGAQTIPPQQMPLSTLSGLAVDDIYF